MDRWIFAFMATLLLVTVLSGSIPASIQKVSAIQSGARAPFLPILHVHAVLMGSWIVLLLAQASLVAINQQALHQYLGMTSVGLVPAMVLAGLILVPANFRLVWGLDPRVVPAEVIAGQKTFISNIALAQLRIGILFPLFVALAANFDTCQRALEFYVVAVHSTKNNGR